MNAEKSRGLSIFPAFFFPVFLVLLFSTPAGGERGRSLPVPVREVEVVAVYPHDTEAFTQGLFFKNGSFFESTGLYGRSSIRQVEPETGRVLRMEKLPDKLFGEGLAPVGNRLVQITWRARLGLVYDEATFRLLRALPLPGEGWGLAADGKRLVLSDGSSLLRFLDPETLRVIGSVKVHDGDREVRHLNELEMIHDLLWANVWQTDRIARIDVATGRVVDWIDLSGLPIPPQERGPDRVLNGIAHDREKDRIFVTGKRWSRLFEIRLQPLPEAGKGADTKAQAP